jgi:phosphatidylserine/phosphatidylglycerophosphate/cardiolipin synthase-like enzyme
MTSAICQLSTEELNRLAGALRSGRIAPPFSPLVLKRYVSDSVASAAAAELQQRVEQGIEAHHLADCLDLLQQDRRQRPAAEDLIDLVWTGPEAPGIVNRDTSVVVREMFQSAKQSVLIAGYAVYQGHTVFKELAHGMDQNPNLQALMHLDIQRAPHDQSSPAERVRAFGERFVRWEWPGHRLPAVYYDPRSLEVDPAKRASLHAKCIVVDDQQAFVSSANFTEAAQTRNIEAGVLIQSRSFATKLAEHFRKLVIAGFLKPVPLHPR